MVLYQSCMPYAGDQVAWQMRVCYNFKHSAIATIKYAPGTFVDDKVVCGVKDKADAKCSLVSTTGEITLESTQRKKRCLDLVFRAAPALEGSYIDFQYPEGMTAEPKGPRLYSWASRSKCERVCSGLVGIDSSHTCMCCRAEKHDGTVVGTTCSKDLDLMRPVDNVLPEYAGQPKAAMEYIIYNFADAAAAAGGPVPDVYEFNEKFHIVNGDHLTRQYSCSAYPSKGQVPDQDDSQYITDYSCSIEADGGSHEVTIKGTFHQPPDPAQTLAFYTFMGLNYDGDARNIAHAITWDGHAYAKDGHFARQQEKKGWEDRKWAPTYEECKGTCQAWQGGKVENKCMCCMTDQGGQPCGTEV